MSDTVEVGTPTVLCSFCGKPADGIHACATCGKVFCREHATQLALAHTGGMNFVYVCEQCIIDGHYHVVDINHPFYMKHGGNPK